MFTITLELFGSNCNWVIDFVISEVMLNEHSFLLYLLYQNWYSH